MSSRSQRIEISLETALESIALAEQVGVCIASVAGFEQDDQYKIGLAVHEAVMNAYQYGNKQCREKRIDLVFEVLREKLVVRVKDQGAGYRIEDVPDPRTDENLMGDSGRGVLLMKAFMDEFDVVTRGGGGAEVIMAKRYRTQESPLVC
jgi:serine/threonine-protein kinase RsbW